MIFYLGEAVLFVALLLTSLQVLRMRRELQRMRAYHAEFQQVFGKTETARAGIGGNEENSLDHPSHPESPRRSRRRTAPSAAATSAGARESASPDLAALLALSCHISNFSYRYTGSSKTGIPVHTDTNFSLTGRFPHVNVRGYVLQVLF